MESRMELGLRKILGESVEVPEPMSRAEELLKQIAEQGISGEGGGSGTPGRGIQKIEKTNTEGLVDTYTITYTDATTSTFTITNGRDGEDGAPGQVGTPGENGVTPMIGENGNWFLGETDTGKPSRGEQGIPGQDGSDGAPGQTGSPGADGFSPTIAENSENTESVYKLDITTKTESFTTPNLKGADGSGGGTSDYTGLANKPRINSVELTGNKTADDLGLITKNQGSTHIGKFMRVGADGNITPYRLSSSDVGSRVFIADSSTTIATLWELMTNPNYDLTMLKINANEGKSNSLYIIASGKRTDDNNCTFTTFPFFSNTTSGSESLTVVTISGAELDTIGESMEVHELAIPASV